MAKTIKKTTPKKITLKFGVLTKEQWDIAHNNGGGTGGYMKDERFIKPFIMRYPNPWEKRQVDVTITRYQGYPHYWVHISEERNQFLSITEKNKLQKDAGKFCFYSPWEDMDKDPFYMQLIHTMSTKTNWYALYKGSNFSKECNSVAAAEKYIKDIIAANFADSTQYEIKYDDYTTETCYRDGD